MPKVLFAAAYRNVTGKIKLILYCSKVQSLPIVVFLEQNYHKILMSNSDAERKSLYTLFLESVQSRLRHGEESVSDIITEQQATKQSLIKMQSIAERHLELDVVHDPLLAINFAR